MDEMEDVPEALDLGASVACLETREDLEQLLPDPSEPRFKLAMDMLDAFETIDRVTGWPRSGMASLLGCQHPDPGAWLDVEVGELQHSRDVVNLIRDISERAAALDHSVRVLSLEALAPSLSPADAHAVAQREASRSAVRLCRDMLRQARGSIFAVNTALADGTVLELVAADLPGEAALVARDRLGPNAIRSALIERQLADYALEQLDADDETSV